MEFDHLSTDRIEAGLAEVLASPKEVGLIGLIVSRPAPGQREVLQAAYLSPETGLEGDRWAEETQLRLPGGRPTGGDQVSLMNSRLLRLLAGDEARMPLAGDNLVVDLDLGEANLPAGQQLRAGDALLEITDVPHTGCAQFAVRFGPDAARFVNASQRRALRLRGVFARVIEAGMVRAGDSIRKMD
jgi:MOSC domain-containing protein YiiM